MADRKTLNELVQELKDQICPEWQDEFAGVMTAASSQDFNDHIGKFSDGCRTCWPVLRKMLDFMAGEVDDVVQLLRKGPEPEQTFSTFMDSIEQHLAQIDT